MEVSRRLVVRGFVQGVGYRAFVKQVAYRLKIRGTVQNLHDGGVEIYARAEPEAIDRFKEFLLSQSPGDVDNIEEYPEGTEGYGKGPEEWIGFNILRDDYSSLEETMEYVVLGGVRLEKEMKTGFSELGNKIDTLSEKTDKGFSELGNKIDTLSEKTDKGFSELGNKVDGVADKVDSVGHKVDTVGNKIDVLSEKTDKGFSELGDKIDTGFSELGEKIDKSSAESSVRLDTLGKNTGELNEKIDHLSHELPVVVEKVDRFREDTIGAFGELDRKYHVISQNLERLNGNIEKMVEDLGILIREFVEERRNERIK